MFDKEIIVTGDIVEQDLSKLRKKLSLGEIDKNRYLEDLAGCKIVVKLITKPFEQKTFLQYDKFSAYREDLLGNHFPSSVKKRISLQDLS